MSNPSASSPSSRSGPRSAPRAASILPLAFVLAACGGPAPTVADHLVEAPSSSVNVCGDRTGSGGEKAAQAVVPALADAIKAHVDPNQADSAPIPGLSLEIHFVDEGSTTEDERFSVQIPAVPGLNPLPAATGNDETDIKAAETWTTASQQRTTTLKEATDRAQVGSDKVRNASQVPRASAIMTCLASFGDRPVSGTVLISDAENTRPPPDGVKVTGPLLVIQFCVESPDQCKGDLDTISTWWTDHGGGKVSATPANVPALAGQISDAFAAGAR